MQSVLLVIHILIVVALIGVVLLQRSEGGALGTGGGTGSFMTGRGQANALSRATAILGALFFATALLMSILSSWSRAPHSILERGPRPAGQTAPDARLRLATFSISSSRWKASQARRRRLRPRPLRCACRSLRAGAEALTTDPTRALEVPDLALVPRRAPRSPQGRRDVRSRRRRRALSGIRAAMQGAARCATESRTPTARRRSSPT